MSHLSPNVVAKGEAEEAVTDDTVLQAALQAPAHHFNPDALRRKYALPLGRTTAEIISASEQEVAALSPEKRAEAEHAGLL